MDVNEWYLRLKQDIASGVVSAAPWATDDMIMQQAKQLSLLQERICKNMDDAMIEAFTKAAKEQTKQEIEG